MESGSVQGQAAVTGTTPPVGTAETKKRTRRKKEVKPRAPRTVKSCIIIMSHDADHDVYNAVTTEGKTATFGTVRLAIKHIREVLNDGSYAVMRILAKKIKTTETIKKSVLK